MAAQKILRGDMPRTDNNRKKLDVSHLCHNSICVKPIYLVLETHQTNLEIIPGKVMGSTQNSINHFVCCDARFSEVYFFLFSFLLACLTLYKYDRGGIFQAAQEVAYVYDTSLLLGLFRTT